MPSDTPSVATPVPVAVGPWLRLWAGLLGALVVACWAFPRWWYVGTAGDAPRLWLIERTNVPGWTFKAESVSESEERQLAADELFAGRYDRPSGERVSLFTARRLDENPNLLGLFVHTPDFCWAQAGWRLDAGLRQDVVRLVLHGIPLEAERRVFFDPANRGELVYFFGLIGGQPLGYRLDHNLAIARRSAVTRGGVRGGSVLAGTDNLFWRRIWQGFVERRALLGPKQFVRVSVPLQPGREAAAEALIREALETLLAPVPLASRQRGSAPERKTPRHE